MYDARRIRSQVNPEDRSSLEDVRACIEKKREKTINHPTGTSQAKALETYDRRIATGATPNKNQLQKMMVLQREHPFV